jgi:hypothetical protein
LHWLSWCRSTLRALVCRPRQPERHKLRVEEREERRQHEGVEVEVVHHSETGHSISVKEKIVSM